MISPYLFRPQLSGPAHRVVHDLQVFGFFRAAAVGLQLIKENELIHLVGYGPSYFALSQDRIEASMKKETTAKQQGCE